ncbi:hypothetical protein [Streptomyces klenkii]
MRRPVQHEDDLMLPWGVVAAEFWAGAPQEAASQEVAPEEVAPQEADAAPEQQPPAGTTDDGAVVEADASGTDASGTDVFGIAAEAEGTAWEGKDPAARAEAGQPESVPLPPPEQYQQRIATITAAFNAPHDASALAEAGREAERLDEEITAQYGPEHVHTINIRELRGWLAYVKGEHSVATRWYLHTAGLQTAVWGAEHQSTQESARRAAHIWNAITDSREALALGTELLTMLAAVTGEDSKTCRYVRKRLGKLQAQQE